MHFFLAHIVPDWSGEPRGLQGDGGNGAKFSHQADPNPRRGVNDRTEVVHTKGTAQFEQTIEVDSI